MKCPMAFVKISLALTKGIQLIADLLIRQSFSLLGYNRGEVPAIEFIGYESKQRYRCGIGPANGKPHLLHSCQAVNVLAAGCGTAHVCSQTRRTVGGRLVSRLSISVKLLRIVMPGVVAQLTRRLGGFLRQTSILRQSLGPGVARSPKPTLEGSTPSASTRADRPRRRSARGRWWETLPPSLSPRRVLVFGFGDLAAGQVPVTRNERTGLRAGPFVFRILSGKRKSAVEPFFSGGTLDGFSVW
jgi:hypothetical protein